jgi:hypothetical protein
MRQFTEKNKVALAAMIAAGTFENWKFQNSFGAEINIQSLLHDTTVNTLKKILVALKRQKTSLEESTSWEQTPEQEHELQVLETKAELVDYIIGYKIFLSNDEKTQATIAAYEQEIARIEQETMKPEDRIKELKSKIDALKGVEESEEAKEEAKESGQTIAQ